MEHLLEESVSSEDLKRFETRYHEELATGKATPSAQFEYAWCLVRSKYPADIRKGILLLEDLYQVPRNIYNFLPDFGSSDAIVYTLENILFRLPTKLI